MPRVIKPTKAVKPVKPKKAAKPAKRPPGRASTYTQKVADEICARLAAGEPLAQICRDAGMPGYRTVADWRAAREDFAAAIACAREEGFDVIAASCMDIADDTQHDTLLTESGDRPNTEWISRSKLRIETRLKLLAKWDPKRYGEKLAIGGASDLPPIQTMSNDDLDAKIAALMARGGNGSDE